MIWKAPWGNHIDLSKIVEISFIGPLYPYGFGFYIRFQLMDKAVNVEVWQHHRIDGNFEKTDREILTEWHNEIVKAWNDIHL